MVIRKRFFIFVILILLPGAVCLGVLGREAGEVFAGEDLHLAGRELISYQPSTGEHVLVFGDGFSMSIGANRFSSERAVVRLISERMEFRGRVRIDYDVSVYLEGGISSSKGRGAKMVEVREVVVEEGRSMVVGFMVSGEVFATAEKREVSDPRGLGLYERGIEAMKILAAGREFVVRPEARVPELPAAEEVAEAEPLKPKAVERVFEPKKKEVKPPEVVVVEVKEPRFRYPVNMAPVGEVEPQIESTRAADGSDVATVIGRFYFWQKQDERGGVLELQADNAVIFYVSSGFEEAEGVGAEVLAEGAIRAVYLSGDVVMSEGERTIRSDELYYDFERQKAIAINAVMRNFDSEREIPIYVRASKLRRLAEDKFWAEDITLTSSEFYKPQISLTASSVMITDTTVIDEQMGEVSDSSYDAQMRDVRMKVGERTIFYWPFMRSNLERPDIPIKSVRAGHDNTWGTSIETRWYLARLLGLREAEGTESTYALDYYDKRGLGTGIEIDYEREDYYGRLLGYLIRDSGEDRLGRARSRRDLKPPREFRGRVFWQHRQFLPYNWQLTTGLGYASDENFIEGYYRNEFNIGVSQETYIHLKRIEDNWGLSFLGKGRINDFSDELEESPSGEFHLTGESFFDDRLTLYMDSQISRLRQRIGNEHTTLIDEDMFSFISHRTEVDMPLRADPFKVVPFVAGTFGYDDRSGFTRTLVDGSNAGEFGDDKVWIGEAGVRVSSQYWKVYPGVKSRLWDLNQLRHIIRPNLTAVVYEQSDLVVEQRDTLNFGISQRLETKRGAGEKERTVDWMRLDMDVTWVNNSGDGSSGPDRFIWNRPLMPLRIFSSPEIFSGDLSSSLRRFELYGPRRNYFGADYIWRLSDTAALLSDMNFDMQSGVFQQFNIGFSRLCWPNLSYYIGSRYLRRIEILDEKGTNSFTFSATYVLDPRYRLVFSQQYDFDYGANIRSDIGLIRRYHRIFCGLTYSADTSLDRQAIVLSIWPQGLPELALGPRRYMGLGTAGGYW